jgi:hypothetical protein
VSNFGSVSKGDKGGFVEKKANLSQYGNAWVSGYAHVSGNALVSGNAWVYGDAHVYKTEKLIAGYFYHTKQKSEKIEVMANDDAYETLCSNPKYDTAPDEKDLTGEIVEVKVAGKTYKAKII